MANSAVDIHQDRRAHATRATATLYHTAIVIMGFRSPRIEGVLAKAFMAGQDDQRSREG